MPHIEGFDLPLYKRFATLPGDPAPCPLAKAERSHANRYKKALEALLD